ncbi:MAG: hypothetical protein AB8B91_15350 [Rubripirellula sp.]
MTERHNRFVVLRHVVGPKSDRTDQTHFDWMFEVEGELRTWATVPVADFAQSFKMDADRLPNHRIEYLDFEGDVSGDRGSVQRVLRGQVHVTDDDSRRFTAELSWEQEDQVRRASVAIYRSLLEDRLRVDDSRDVWRLRFSLGR